MQDTSRNPWQRLNPSQIAQLDAAYEEPQHLQQDPPEAYREISIDFAQRCAVMLVHNDLRGALDAAEISWAAQRLADHREMIAAESAERLERIRAELNPHGRWVEIPGLRKRVRVMPGENVQQRIDERRAELLEQQSQRETRARGKAG